MPTAQGCCSDTRFSIKATSQHSICDAAAESSLYRKLGKHVESGKSTLGRDRPHHAPVFVNLVLQGGGNVVAEMLPKIVAAMWARGVSVLDEFLLRTALAHDVCPLDRLIADVHDGGAFELAREQHNAAVALFLEQWSRANRALQLLKAAFAKSDRDVIEP